MGIIKNSVDKVLECNKDYGIEKALEVADTMNRTIIIEEIDDESGVMADSFIRFWNKYDEEQNIPIEERTPIKIYIDSPGGSLLSTFTIIDSIELSKTPIYTINIGCAYSGGFFIFICGHKRFAYKTSSFMYHEGSINSGAADAGKFRNQAAFYDKQLNQLKEIVLSHTNFSEEYYKEHQRDDLWLTAEEAVSLGACDIITDKFI